MCSGFELYCRDSPMFQISWKNHKTSLRAKDAEANTNLSLVQERHHAGRPGSADGLVAPWVSRQTGTRIMPTELHDLHSIYRTKAREGPQLT